MARNWQRNFYARPLSKRIRDYHGAGKWANSNTYSFVIPVTWNGVQYRSKAEGRAAVFLHEAGYAPLYEPESFALIHEDGEIINYLPDFFIPRLDLWIEVKAKYLTQLDYDYKKVLAFSRSLPDHQKIATTWGLGDASHWRYMVTPDMTNIYHYKERWCPGFCKECNAPSFFKDTSNARTDFITGLCVVPGCKGEAARDPKEQTYTMSRPMILAQLAASEETFGI